MGYTDDEIRAMIEKLMLTAPRRGVDILGVRSTGVESGDYLELISTTLLNAPMAPWYLVQLGAARALEEVRTASSICARVLAAIQEVDRKVPPVRDLSSLATARAALIDMDVAASSRTTATTTTQTPAYTRFARSVENFLGQYGAGIRRDGDIVMTPAEARTTLRGSTEDLHAVVDRINAWVVDLLGVEASFAAVNLPGRAISGLISRTRTLLDSRLDSLEAKTPEARVEDLRTVVLELITSRSLLTRYGAARPDIGGPRTTGTGTPWSDATHLAKAAYVVGQRGPFALVENRERDLWKAAAPIKTTVVVTVGVYSNMGQTQPYRAVLTRASGSFITDGVVLGDAVYLTGTNDNTKWVVQVVGATELVVVGSALVVPGSSTAVVRRAPDNTTLLPASFVAEIAGSSPAPFAVPPGGLVLNFTALLNTEVPFTATFAAGTLSATDAVAAIQLGINTAGLNADVGVLPYASPASFDGVVDILSGPGGSRFTLQSGTLTGLGVVPGDTVVIMSGVDAGRAVTISVASTTYVETTEVGVADLTGVRIQIGRGGARLRVFLLDGTHAVENTYGLRLEATSTAALLVGMPPGGEIRSRASYSAKVAASIAVPDFSASSTSTSSTSATIELVGAASALIYDIALTGDVSSPAANTLEITYTGEIPTLPGDLLVLRSGADTGSLWVVDSVGTSSIVATGTTTPTTATGIAYVTGPPSAGNNEVITISSGVNRGEYEIQSVFGLIAEVTPAFPFLSTPAGPFTATATLQERAVQVASKDQTTASYVLLGGPAARALTGTSFRESWGTTSFFKLPATVEGLAMGDFLDFYSTTYTAADTQIKILGVEGDLLELETPISSLVSWAFQGPPPFAALRSAAIHAYAVLRIGLTAWNNAQQTSYWNDLRRTMNPLIFELNPSAVQQGTARNAVLELYGVLSRDGAAAAGRDPTGTLEAFLEAYQAPSVPLIDALFRTLQEKGLDRAIDLLTRCRVKDLFASSIESLSFLGQLQSTLREVARQDLPVRKDDRREAFVSPRVYTEEDGVDYEYEPDGTPAVSVSPPPTKRP